MELLKAIEGIRSPFLDTVIGLITRLGEETVAIVVMCVIYWCISKKTAYIIGVVYFLSGLTVQGMKICFRIDRPWVIDPTFTPVEGALKYATGYSFPSGHTQAAAALLGSLAARIRQIPVKVILIVLAVLVAFSRMYLGVHTLIDVVVSLVICLLFVLLTVKVFGRDDCKKRDFILSLSMVLYAIVVIVIAAVLYAGGTIEQHYLSDCLKAAGASIGFAAGMYIERTYIRFPVRSKNIVIQAVKFVLGFAGVLLIKEGLKLIIGTGFAADTVRYFLMLTWMTVFFPLLIKRFFSIKSEDS
jgi:undecaprenyl-diphosphatase